MSTEPATNLPVGSPKEFSTTHWHMFAMRAAGMRPGEIADATGYSASRVSVILNDPRAKAIVARMTGDVLRDFQLDVRDLIQSYTGEAVETVATLMRHAESEQVRLSASKDLLDRGGFKPKEVVTHAHVEIDHEDAQRILSALHESQQQAPALEMVEDSAGVFRSTSDVPGQ